MIAWYWLLIGIGVTLLVAFGFIWYIGYLIFHPEAWIRKEPYEYKDEGFQGFVRKQENGRKEMDG